ncbi:MAG: TIGR02147 family protein [Fibrobacter sp.]|nr:TIGR02147 family protein [Fibrobacter sp.]
MVNLLEYQNYREYLKDYYNEQKRTKKYFSYRYFAQKADINASAFLYYVIEGKRNLTKKSIIKISTAIGHTKEEAEYFENLVFFNQAQTIAEKSMYYTKIVEHRKTVDIKIVGEDQYEFYSKWYHSVIRELAPLIDFKDDFSRLARMIDPAITVKDARESIQLLEKLGLLELDENGMYHQTDALLSVKPDAKNSFLIEKFQQEMLSLATRSFDKIARTDRMSSSTTVSVSKDTFELLKVKTREYRKELLELVKLDTAPDRIYQLTINLFPISRSINEKLE